MTEHQPPSAEHPVPSFDPSFDPVAADPVPGDSVPGDSVPGDSVPDNPVAADSVPGDSVIAMMAADRASAALGIQLLEHGPGWARTSMTVRADMTNGHDLAHGGLLFTLADTAFACACNSWGPATVAAGCEITFVAPAHLGDVLEAEANARTRFGRNGVYDVTVRRGDQVIAEFRGHSHQLARS